MSTLAQVQMHRQQQLKWLRCELQPAIEELDRGESIDECFAGFDLAADAFADAALRAG